MKKMIALDMDGTIADLYGVPNWITHLHNYSAVPYEKATPLVDMAELNGVLIQLKQKGWKIGISSWLTYDELMTKEYAKNIRKAKREWLKKHNFPADEIHIVGYGRNKWRTFRKISAESILIDDSKQCRATWKGSVIDPTTENVIEKLKALLKED